LFGIVIECAEAVDLADLHVRVGVETIQSFEALALAFARGLHALALTTRAPGAPGA